MTKKVFKDNVNNIRDLGLMINSIEINKKCKKNSLLESILHKQKIVNLLSFLNRLKGN
jgi:hypothetical protein